MAPEVVGQSRTDIHQGDLDVDLAVALGDEQQLAGPDVVHAGEVVAQVDGRSERANFPRLRVSATGRERAKPFHEGNDEFVGSTELTRTVLVQAG